MTTTETAHILLDSAGVAWIDDTKTKVIEVILNWIAYGWGPGEIHQQHPHLSLAQIHAAFAYYYDHQDALDAEIKRRREYADKLAAKSPETPGRKKLREQGLRP